MFLEQKKSGESFVQKFRLISKKAQVADQFNWIFAIIAGGIILLFFLFVIAQVRATADAKLAVTVLNNFDAILTGASVTSNSLNIIDSTKLLEFDVSCESDGLSILNLEGSTAEIDLSQRMLYSPYISTGQRLYLYVVPIERPFDLGNAMLLASDSILFAVYNSDGIPGLDEFYDVLPENISKEKISQFTRDHKSYDKIVVYSTKAAPKMSGRSDEIYGADSLSKKEVVWIKLTFEDVEAKRAEVFYKSKKKSVFEYMGDTHLPSNEFAMFLGFSKDLEFYQCNFNKINSKLRVVSKIYLERVRILINTVTKANCASKYLDAEDILIRISESESSYGESDLVETLENINHGLLLNSCPLVY